MVAEMTVNSALLFLLTIAILASCSVAEGHRMMMGYMVNELQATALYDDGTPAQDVEIQVLRDGKIIEKGLTDDKGTYTFRPEKRTGQITFVSYSAGHRAELSLNLEQKRQEETLSLPLRAFAGIGYLMGIAGLSMIYSSRKRK
jgi:nickel transport protein